MSATRITFRLADERMTRRFGFMHPEERPSQAELERPLHELGQRSAVELARTPRMRSLAGFLGLDPVIVAGGIIDGLEQDRQPTRR